MSSLVTRGEFLPPVASAPYRQEWRIVANKTEAGMFRRGASGLISVDSA